MKHRTLSAVYIIGGIFLFIVMAGDLLFRIFCMLFALMLVNTGLQMRGMPPLHMLILWWLENMRWR